VHWAPFVNHLRIAFWHVSRKDRLVSAKYGSAHRKTCGRVAVAQSPARWLHGDAVAAV